MATLRYPLLRQAPITTTFGAPAAIGGAPHTGVDFGATYGTPVLAANAGTIRSFENLGGGHMLAIAGSDGLETRYAHLSARFATSGSVRAGQVIGAVGASGAATGAHLHFEVLEGGVFHDPLPYLGIASTAPATLIGAPASGQSSSLGKAPLGPFDSNGTIIPGPLAKDANGQDYYPNVKCEAGWVARPSGQARRPRCFPADQAPGVGPALGAVPGDVLGLLSGPLLQVGANVAIIGGGLLLIYKGITRALGT